MIKVNEKEIKFTKFPNNETLVDTEVLNDFKNRTIKDWRSNPIKIEFKFYEDSDILKLYFVLSHLKSLESLCSIIHLYIYYMPYSRMDRNQNSNCFTLQYIKNLLQSVLDLGGDSVIYIVEPHSDESLKYTVEFNDMGAHCKINANAKRINVITPLMNKVLEEHPEISAVCYPDAGAMKRFKDDETKLPIVYCNKVRDFNTGEIKGLELVKDENLDLTGRNVLILDDLSSKGGTFYYTACELKKAGANKVYLGICHCENAIREGNIYVNPKDGKDKFSPIEHIYCTDSMLMDNQVAVMKEGNMTIYDLEEFLETGELIPNTNLSLY